MKIAIQKFGGTSLGTLDRQNMAILKIIEKVKKGYQVVVVVSAMGKEGNHYSTDSLIKLINKEKIRKKELDLLMSCGEKISATVMSSLLNEKGFNTTVLTGYQAGIITNNNFGDSEIIEINPFKLLEELERKEIVIVTGFQGGTSNGEVTTLGRGGSDITAVILGIELGCKSVEVFTDVNGVMTADPNIVTDAKLINSICYSNAYQLAESGAKVIHSKAVKIAERNDIEIKIKNTLNNCSGTTISNKYPNRVFNDSSFFAITYKKDITQFIIETKNKSEVVSEIIKDQGRIALIDMYLNNLILTVQKNEVEKIKKILTREHHIYKIYENYSIISVIKHKIADIPKITLQIMDILKNNNIEVLKINGFYSKIQCLVKTVDVEKAINLLHETLKVDLI